MPDWRAHVRTYLNGGGVPPEFEAGIIEELAQHLEQRYEEMLASGVPVETAEHEVASELSGERLREQVRRIAQRYESVAIRRWFLIGAPGWPQ